MKPGGGRAKGHAFERLVANLFKAAGWTNAKRGLGQARHAEVPDVQGVPPWWPELKRMRKCDIPAALAQALRDCTRDPSTPYTIPVAITKDDNGPIVVSMFWDDWLKMVKLLQS